MYRPSALVRLAAAAAAITLISAPAAEAGSRPSGAAPARTSGPLPADRFNVANTHSPRVEHMLAAGRARPPGVRPTGASAAGAAGPGTLASAVQGIDVASAQHSNGASINWNEVAGAGYKFAFIKATEGAYYANPYYAGDAAGAEAADLVVAPYHFAIPNYSGGAFQADYALDHSGYTADGHTLLLIVDLENDPYAGVPPPNGDGTSGVCYGLSPAQMVAWISAFAAETHRRTGRSPGIYTTAAWWQTCTGDSHAFTADPLWIASLSSSPATPAGWANWTYWQYSASATVPGITGKADVSYLSASALELPEPASQRYRAGALVSLTATSLDGGQLVTYAASGLPPGLSINPSTGVISGTLAAKPATFRSSITATATGTPKAAESFLWYVHGAVSIGGVRPATGSVGTPVRLAVPAADALPGCTLRFAATGLPRGLSMNSCGLLSGWPSATGQYQVSVQVTDSSGASLAQRTFGWDVAGDGGRGPAGQVRLRRDGKCLARLAAADIAIEPCGSAGQRWTIAANGSVRVAGKCLTATSSALSLGACRNGGQRWQLSSGGALTDLAAGKCLADNGAKNGSRAVAATCYARPNNTGSASTPGANQRWILPAGPLAAGVAGFCASDWHRRGSKLGGVTLRACNRTSPQDWTIEPDGTVRTGGQCLSLTSGHVSYGTTVRLYRCNQSATQQWQLAGGPIGVQLVSPVAGLCLGDPGDRTVGGTKLALGGCVAGDPGVSWRVS
ncbi:MAG: GH25 family lysozyme [Streptosporangiaceae bacterium]